MKRFISLSRIQLRSRGVPASEQGGRAWDSLRNVLAVLDWELVGCFCWIGSRGDRVWATYVTHKP